MRATFGTIISALSNYGVEVVLPGLAVCVVVLPATLAASRSL
jgi:hypothetical protein